MRNAFSEPRCVLAAGAQRCGKIGALLRLFILTPRMNSPPPTITAPSQRMLLWLVAMGFFMQTLDGTILNTALPAMARTLGESPLRMQSVVIAYMLTVALLIPASGWLADRFGTRRVFMSAIALFTLGSLLCALSPSLPLLVAARVVQGVGGALLLPVGRLAILRAFPREALISAMSFVVLPGLVGPLIGPTLGGWLVAVASWHWVFLINIPVGLVGLWAARRYMPDFRGSGPVSFDRPGFALLSVGLVLVTLALQGLGEGAVSAAVAIIMLCAGLATTVAYWLYAARATQPLFSPTLFRSPTFAVGIAGNLFSRLGSGAMPFLTPLFLQVALGYSPQQAGMMMIPTALGAMAAKLFAERAVKGLGYRRLLISNTLLLGILIAAFALIQPGQSRAVILLMLGAYGMVSSLQFSAMNTLTLGDLDAANASAGNSLLSVVMQVSVGLGVATASALLAAFAGPGAHAANAKTLAAFHATYLCAGALSILAAGIFLQLKRGEGTTDKSAALHED